MLKKINTANKRNNFQQNRIILSLLIILTLVLSSCTGSSTASSRDINYRTGSKALELKLFNQGSEDFFEGDELIILVEYFNRGTADIASGQFFVSGYDPKYLNLNLDPSFININGKDEFDPEGRRSQVLTIKSSPLRIPKNSEEFSQTVKLTACYDYTTLATAELCIDSDPYGRTATNKICTMSSVSPGAQGAPLVVTKVEPIVSRNDFRLNIEVANNGGGLIYDRRISNEKCFADLDKYSDLDKIDVVRVDFSGRSMKCTPTNPVRLVDGRGSFTCECAGCINPSMGSYKTQVSMELKYGYRDEIMKNVRIFSD